MTRWVCPTLLTDFSADLQRSAVMIASAMSCSLPSATTESTSLADWGITQWLTTKGQPCEVDGPLGRPPIGHTLFIALPAVSYMWTAFSLFGVRPADLLLFARSQLLLKSAYGLLEQPHFAAVVDAMVAVRRALAAS